jgi:hypothetical protein
VCQIQNDAICLIAPLFGVIFHFGAAYQGVVNGIISHDNMPFLEEDPQIVSVRPGQTVYFQYTMSWGLIFEEADDQERAAITASKLIPLN